MNLVDFYLRRTPLFLSEPDQGIRFIEPISRVFAENLNWSQDELRRQLAAVQAKRQSELAWRTNLRGLA